MNRMGSALGPLANSTARRQSWFRLRSGIGAAVTGYQPLHPRWQGILGGSVVVAAGATPAPLALIHVIHKRRTR
jgi:hypothetical protein